MEKLKAQICRCVDNDQNMILNIAESIWRNPETGFNELKTAELVKRTFNELGLKYQSELAVTGCRAEIDSGRPGPSIALIGELDALCLKNHPAAAPETGAVHVCGHHLQIAALLGAAAALKKTNAMAQLRGKVVFIAVPAEEFGLDEVRLSLLRDKKICFVGGKQEMIRLGVFDDIDMALMVHAGDHLHYPQSYNGFIMKKVKFSGVATHAGLCPENGVNALYAANVAMTAINSQRETFRDADSVRVHGIINNGGDSVNIIPDNVEMTIQIRAKTIDAIKDAAAKVDRSLKAGAMAMGCGVTIETLTGYMPLRSNHEMAEIYEKNLQMLHPGAKLENSGHRSSSTDMGDLSCIMPVLPAYSGGAEGKFHSTEFKVIDPLQACVEPAKLLAMTAVDLLNSNSVPADDQVISKARYLEYLESFGSVENFSAEKTV